MLRNPAYFFLLFVILVGAYITYQLNLWGPMIKMANAASAQALEEGKKRLREFLEASEGGQRIAMEGRREQYEMQTLKGRGRSPADDGSDAEDDI